MKSKLRKLNVAGREFRWRVVRLSERYVCLRIWTSEDPNMPWLQLRCRFDDPWLRIGDPAPEEGPSKGNESLRPVRPSFVREVIEQTAAKQGWPGAPVRCRHYALNGESIEEIADVHSEDGVLVSENRG